VSGGEARLHFHSLTTRATDERRGKKKAFCFEEVEAGKFIILSFCDDTLASLSPLTADGSSMFSVRLQRIFIKKAIE
jgi:hypothetical protein